MKFTLLELLALPLLFVAIACLISVFKRDGYLLADRAQSMLAELDELAALTIEETELANAILIENTFDRAHAGRSPLCAPNQPSTETKGCEGATTRDAGKRLVL